MAIRSEQDGYHVGAPFSLKQRLDIHFDQRLNLLVSNLQLVWDHPSAIEQSYYRLESYVIEHTH